MEILKLVAPCKDYLWGGRKLKDKYGKSSESDVVAESWELSFHKDGPTRLENGETLQSVATENDLGKNCKDFPFFPMLEHSLTSFIVVLAGVLLFEYIYNKEKND